MTAILPEHDELHWWVDETTGLRCLALAHGWIKVWNGYVGVEAGHPLYAARMNYVDFLEVHGGVTFVGERDNTDTYWIGFDCGHAWDIKPGLEQFGVEHGLPPLRMEGSEYRNLSYVKAECAKLALQLAAIPSRKWVYRFAVAREAHFIRAFNKTMDRRRVKRLARKAAKNG